MRKNKLRIINVDTFKGLDQLEILILWNNQIEEINPESFTDLSNLIELKLNKKKIEKNRKGNIQRIE